MRDQRASVARALAHDEDDEAPPYAAAPWPITPIRSTTGFDTPSSVCTRRPDEICTDGFSSSNWPETIFRRRRGGGARRRRRRLEMRKGRRLI
ncbi:hypothetical protein F511_46441 [Dorcoceras hygrometricum]|uniref:Uncharacterized protein n=1 Tax=Dorcoceras hygrometricum TaxID=472368 RepID=A0A2Z6ZTK4_9LAMI|nr:hypothetical protein F511_46441 [Dorcoceras hygrometricum]